ncbi:hypothetical protein JS562_47445, partial [Agrobacterium sp. S2]|nr:hypothetical protein [Agrobacterium sp. S2]
MKTRVHFHRTNTSDITTIKGNMAVDVLPPVCNTKKNAKGDNQQTCYRQTAFPDVKPQKTHQ